MHFIYIGGVLAGIFGLGWVAKESGDAIEATAKPIKWLVAGGTVYVAYKALQASGAVK